MDSKTPVQMKEIYEFLNGNYVEDAEAMFRFDYSKEFLEWYIGGWELDICNISFCACRALRPPGMFPEWLVGVRVSKSHKLVGFIAAVPAHLSLCHQAPQLMVEINFLCVHKKLRDKRLAPVLIKEITRRVNLRGIFQAAYTAGTIVPTPVVGCRLEGKNGRFGIE